MSCLGVMVASLLPMDVSVVKLVFNYWDKSQHAVAYAFLTFLGLKAFPNQMKYVLLGLCIMGAVIEIIQGALPWRHGELLDMVANATGIFAVYGISQLRTVGKKE